MRNKIGSSLFGIGLIGTLFFGSGLDSPGNGWLIALGFMAAFGALAAIGYSIMDPVDFSMKEEGNYEDAHQRRSARRRVG